MELMKKIVVILAVCCIIWVTSIISVGAESTLSKDEALDLIVNASDFCNTVVDGYAYGTWGPLLDYDSEAIIMNIDGREYKYYAVFEERLPGGSYNGMKEYAKDIFCVDLAASIYESDTSWYNGEPVPRYYVSEDGKVYSCLYVDFFSYVCFSNYDWEEISYDDGWLIKFVSGNSSQATYYARALVGHELDSYLAWVEVNFVNTENGWRIDRCTYTDILANDMALSVWEKDLIPYDESPSTGDISGEKVAVIGAVSLACIIPTACLMRRRRRMDTI
jgi:hypothetical protein